MRTTRSALIVCMLLAAISPAAAQDRVFGDQPAGIPDASWVEIYFHGFNRVVKAAGLEPLLTATLPDGKQKEVRIWIGGGIGYPQELYRFLVDGTDVEGELILYWPVDDDVGNEASSLEELIATHWGACEDFMHDAGKRTCRAAFSPEPDWAGVYSRAVEAELWTLPDESTLPKDNVLMVDGWGITVELRDGEAYRTYHYGGPDAREWPEAARAVEIAEALRPIREAMRRD